VSFGRSALPGGRTVATVRRVPPRVHLAMRPADRYDGRALNETIGFTRLSAHVRASDRISFNCIIIAMRFLPSDAIFWLPKLSLSSSPFLRSIHS